MRTMVRFRTAEGICAIPAEHVLEVRSAVDVKPFPGRRADVAGMVERDGRPLSVLTTMGGGGGHVLLLTTARGSFGLLVDEVLGLTKVSESAIEPAPAGRSQPLVDAVINAGNGIELLISADELWRQLSGETVTRGPGVARLADEIPLRMLLVEDNVVVQLLTKRLLGKLGYSIDLAVNGKQAIDAIEKTTYDIVLMDLQMPEMDGLDALKEITRRWPSERPAIIAMTASDAGTERQACLDAGMNDYLTKPVREAELSDMLRKWGSGRRATPPTKQNGR